MNPEQIDYDPEKGDILELARTGELSEIRYIDEQIVLLRSEETDDTGRHRHRMTRRSAFDSYLKHGRFKPRPDVETEMGGVETLDWMDVDGVGEQTAQNLVDAGFETALDVQSATDQQLVAVDGVGSAVATNLRQFTS